MGIIAVLLFSQGYLGSEFHVPFWVVITCQAAMALGTLMGGWRIVHTMGSKITRLNPMQGFCAETGGAITLFAATWLGIPVSTTHTITGAIIGVGAAHAASPRCAGALPATSSSPGSSHCRRPLRSPPSSTSRSTRSPAEAAPNENGGSVAASAVPVPAVSNPDQKRSGACLSAWTGCPKSDAVKSEIVGTRRRRSVIDGKRPGGKTRIGVIVAGCRRLLEHEGIAAPVILVRRLASLLHAGELELELGEEVRRSWPTSKKYLSLLS